MRNRVVKKILVSLGFLSAFAFGIGFGETEAMAWHENGPNYFCGSSDIDPSTGVPYDWGGSTWFEDCQALSLVCDRLGPDCSYNGGAFGGSCICV